ncbi:MAG: RNA-binding protein [Verrucomicrobiota bacterium]|nr:RNA-binding protein [Verrucomicrobiota bacterium]
MSTRLFVGNIVFNCTEDDIRALFAQAGTVEDVAMINDKFTGRPRGFAFVTMASQEEANAAVEKFEGYNFDGRPLKVNEARPREERPEGGGFGGGPRGGGGGGGFRPRRPFGGGGGGFGGGGGGRSFGPRRDFGGGGNEGGGYSGGGEGGAGAGGGEGGYRPRSNSGFRPRRPSFRSNDGPSDRRSGGGFSDNY